MAGDYRFDKLTIFILVTAGLFLQVLVFGTGMVVGYKLDRPLPEKTEIAAVEKNESRPPAKGEAVAAGPRANQSALAGETEVGPESPDFEDSSPAAGKPGLSKPK